MNITLEDYILETSMIEVSMNDVMFEEIIAEGAVLSALAAQYVKKDMITTYMQEYGVDSYDEFEIFTEAAEDDEAPKKGVFGRVKEWIKKVFKFISAGIKNIIKKLKAIGARIKAKFSRKKTAESAPAPAPAPDVDVDVDYNLILIPATLMNGLLLVAKHANKYSLELEKAFEEDSMHQKRSIVAVKKKFDDLTHRLDNIEGFNGKTDYKTQSDLSERMGKNGKVLDAQAFIGMFEDLLSDITDYQQLLDRLAPHFYKVVVPKSDDRHESAATKLTNAATKNMKMRAEQKAAGQKQSAVITETEALNAVRAVSNFSKEFIKRLDVLNTNLVQLST